MTTVRLIIKNGTIIFFIDFDGRKPLLLQVRRTHLGSLFHYFNFSDLIMAIIGDDVFLPQFEFSFGSIK